MIHIAHLTIKRYLIVNSMFVAGLFLTIFFTLNIGSEHAVLWGGSLTDEVSRSIILYSRLPRILLGVIVGIALGSAGTAFQSLLRNPLADPFILGVSGGSALGSVIGMALKLPFALIALSGFAAALLSMLFIYRISRYHGRLSPHTLLLTGVIYNAFAFAFIILVHSVVTMEQSHEILFMLIGSLEIKSYSVLAVSSAGVLAGFLILVFFSRNLNIISLGDETAQTLGANINRTRKIIFFAASLMIGSVIGIAGLIGFVGLFIPHIVRALFGSDNRIVLPVSGLLGAIFLVWSDTLARTVLMHGGLQTQLPVGVITALIGAPCFVWLLKKEMT